MSQQAMRSELPDSSDDTVEEALQQIGPPSIRQISPSAKNVWPYWNNILSQLNQTGFPMMKSHEEIAQAGKDTIEALKKSGAAFAEGFGEISQHVAEMTQKSVAANLAIGKEISDIKTPGDWVELQSKWVGDWMTSTISQMAHLSQLSTKVVNQTCEPLKTHFGAALGKMNGFM